MIQKNPGILTIASWEGDPTTQASTNWWFHKNLKNITLQGTNISLKNGILKMIFLFPRWDMLIPWKVLKLDHESPRIRGENSKKPLTCHHLVLLYKTFFMLFVPLFFSRASFHHCCV